MKQQNVRILIADASSARLIDTHRLLADGELRQIGVLHNALQASHALGSDKPGRSFDSGPGGQRLITGPLYKALEQCLAQGEQSILFLNRRGFSPSVRCNACSKVLECAACSVALTLHKGASVLRCHYCDFMTPHTGVCISCGSPHVLPRLTARCRCS